MSPHLMPDPPDLIPANRHLDMSSGFAQRNLMKTAQAVRPCSSCA